MDSITHALYRSLNAEHTTQQQIDKAEPPFKTSGLQPMAKRRSVHDAFADAAPTDLHITLGVCFAELLALQLEFVSAGYSPPADMAITGADVIISPGRVDVYVPTEDGKTWAAILSNKSSERGGRRAGWEEQLS